MFSVSYFSKLKESETNSSIKTLIKVFLVVESKKTLQLRGITELFYTEYFPPSLAIAISNELMAEAKSFWIFRAVN